MRNYLKRQWFCAALLLVGAITFSGCDAFEETALETRVVEVRWGDWSWNSIYKRYECVVNYPSITNYVYEKGTVQGALFLLETGYDDRGNPVDYEVLKPLPFIETYLDEGKSYTRTISFDISPRCITFYIQESDLSDSKDFLSDYQFKVTLLWDK